MVALRRTEHYKTIRHHLRDTRLYDWMRNHTVLAYMFHLSQTGDMFFRTPASDSQTYGTPEGLLTPPPQQGAPLVPMNTERHGFQSNRTVTGRTGEPFPIYIEDFTEAGRNHQAGRAFSYNIDRILSPIGERETTKRTWKNLENVWTDGRFNQGVYDKLTEKERSQVRQAASIFHYVHRYVAAVFYEGVKHDIVPSDEWFTSLWGTVFADVCEYAIHEFNTSHGDVKVSEDVFTDQLKNWELALAAVTVGDDYVVRFDPEVYSRFWGFVFSVLRVCGEPVVAVFARVSKERRVVERRALVVPLGSAAGHVLRHVVGYHVGALGDGVSASAAAVFEDYELSVRSVYWYTARSGAMWDGEYWERDTGMIGKVTVTYTPSDSGSFAMCEVKQH